MTQSPDLYRMPQEYNPQPDLEVQPETVARTVEFSPHELVLLLGHALERVRNETRNDEYDIAA